MKERVKEAKVEAEKWASRPPEDRIKGPLDFWIEGEKRFSHHQPTEDEIQAKKKELVSELRTKEEYELQLIDEIERDIRSKEQAI